MALAYHQYGHDHGNASYLQHAASLYANIVSHLSNSDPGNFAGWVLTVAALNNQAHIKHCAFDYQGARNIFETIHSMCVQFPDTVVACSSSATFRMGVFDEIYLNVELYHAPWAARAA